MEIDSKKGGKEGQKQKKTIENDSKKGGNGKGGKEERRCFAYGGSSETKTITCALERKTNGTAIARFFKDMYLCEASGVGMNAEAEIAHCQLIASMAWG